MSTTLTRRAALILPAAALALPAILRPAVAQVCIPIVAVAGSVTPGSLHLKRRTGQLFLGLTPGEAALFALEPTDLADGDGFVAFHPDRGGLTVCDCRSGAALGPRLAPNGDFRIAPDAFEVLIGHVQGTRPGVIYS